MSDRLDYDMLEKLLVDENEFLTAEDKQIVNKAKDLNAYYGDDQIAKDVLINKYLAPWESNLLEMWLRLAWGCAEAEEESKRIYWAKKFFTILLDFRFVPGGRINYGLGRKDIKVSFSNCYVLGLKDDSLESIYELLKEEAHTYKSGGGCGHDLSILRPEGDIIKGTGGQSCGPIGFMNLFSESTNTVAQNNRRGANMQCLFVHHPDIEKFIDVKNDAKKVIATLQELLKKYPEESESFAFIRAEIEKRRKVQYSNISVKLTDKFMNAVINDEDFDLVWNDKVYKTVKARDLWNKIILNAWESAEPGIMFWDRAVETNNIQYASPITSTNPCFSGDTLIAVADGRNAVTIKQLAEEEKDVPVYSMNKDTGIIEIKMGRHPRITGYNQKLVRIHLEDGSYLDTTPNHKFILLDGTTVEAKDLRVGVSLPRFSKYLEPVKKGGNDYYRIYCNTRNFDLNKVYEHRLITQFFKNEEWNKLYNKLKQNGFSKTGGVVIHHKDYNSLNNSADNLQLMSFVDHCKLHGSVDTKGEKNGRYCGISNEQLKEKALNFTKELGRRFSTKEWAKYAKENNLPQQFSKFRVEAFGSVEEFSKLCAQELGFEYSCDTRVIATYQKMLEQNYSARIQDGVVLVKKICEWCKSEFEIDHLHREASYCSNKCSANGIYNSEEKKKLIYEKIHEKTNERMLKVKIEQARVYSQLKFELNRRPFRKEWEQECKKQNVSFRVGANLKFCFKNYKEVEEAGENYNHKIVKVEELEGTHTVYNITVDDFHTVAVITNVHDKNGKNWYGGIITHQCGEQFLGNGENCLLGHLNLSKFMKCGEFAFSELKKNTEIAVRFLDNVITLNYGLHPLKIQNDAAINARRMGLGILGLGDLYILNETKYGSEKSIKLTEDIMKTMRDTVYDYSSELALEKGVFPLFDRDKYLQNKFIKQLPQELQTKIGSIGIRNCMLLTVAPTGTGAIISQTTGGIEPIFRTYYMRKVKNNIDNSFTEYKVYHPLVKQLFPDGNIPDYVVDSTQITPEERVQTQAIIQKYVDNSISSTVNLPESATVEDVAKVYMLAYKLGCKGITVYRENSRAGVLVSVKDKEAKEKPKEKRHAMKRPPRLQGETFKVKIDITGSKAYNCYVTVNKHPDTDKPYELLVTETNDNKEIKDIMSLEAITRLTSLCLRHNVPVEFIIEQLNKVNGQYIYSLPITIANILANYLDVGDEDLGSNDGEFIGELCPNCNEKKIKRDNGCLCCLSCGFSKCG